VAGSNRSSACTCIGVGCLVVAAVAAACAVGAGFWVYRGAKRIEAELKDPRLRDEQARSILGVARMPDGYYPRAAFTAPFGVMRLAVLLDRPGGPEAAGDDFGERGFVFVEMMRLGQNEQELRDYFEGRGTEPAVLRQSSIRLEGGEVLRRGSLSLDPAQVLYVAQRGGVQMQAHHGKGITTLILVECPQDDKLRLGVWLGPDPDPKRPAAELDLSGTAADEAEISGFLRQFRLCPTT
jgi:hypothetical protein